MPQKRDLLPLTVYLPPDAKAEADKRADDQSIAVGTLLRQILLGKAPPLKSEGGGKT